MDPFHPHLSSTAIYHFYSCFFFAFSCLVLSTLYPLHSLHHVFSLLKPMSSWFDPFSHYTMSSAYDVYRYSLHSFVLFKNAKGRLSKWRRCEGKGVVFRFWGWCSFFFLFISYCFIIFLFSAYALFLLLYACIITLADHTYSSFLNAEIQRVRRRSPPHYKKTCF